MKRYRINISKKGSVRDAIELLQGYKSRLNDACERFVNLLMDAGIRTAKANTGQYAGMITFEKRIEQSDVGCDGILIAMDKEKIIREWYTDKQRTNKRSYEVSPLLLAEFGSGFLAKVLDDVEGVGQGTMPKQKHAFDANGWYWYDETGEKHHSFGEAPTYPMHAAGLAMQFEIEEIGRKVFSNV